MVAEAAIRLDQRLVQNGLVQSRSRARDAVRRGHVTVNGKLERRPGITVNEHAKLVVSDPAQRYVSRSALKLAAGLDHFGFDPAGRIAVDLGASVGGFTQVLLERGARLVVAVDVGQGQLNAAIASNPRVRPLAQKNARHLSAADIGEPIQVLVSDVSFISQKLALPPALDLCEAGAFAIVLVKPQFEVGRAGLGKRGIVRDQGLARGAAEDIADWFGKRPGWRVAGVTASPIPGGDGNPEFLLGAMRG